MDNFLTSRYDFIIPPGKIALYPRKNQELSPLLFVDAQKKSYKDHYFNDVIEIIKPGSVLVVNETKVRKSRFFASFMEIQFEVLLLNLHNFIGECKIRGSRKLKEGDRLFLTPHLSLVISKKQDEGILTILFEGSQKDLEDFLEKKAELPLPPYILKQRPYRQEDERDYQTIFAKQEGSAASPTAALHFTKDIITKIQNKGIQIIPIELYVSLGTFQPIQTEYIKDHPMHKESYFISTISAQKLNLAKKERREIIAVGTTSLRTLESAWDKNTESFKEGMGETDLFITPGYKIRSADTLLTNFHTPKSTLFVLICSILGESFAKECYEHALLEDYQFFSYGDAMLIKNIQAVGDSEAIS